MVVSGTDRKYKKYLEQEDSQWDFENGILYRMCQEHPHYNQEDVITGKIWLIDRSYAATTLTRK